MLKPDPDKHWRIYLFIGSFVCVSIFMFWPYLLGAIVLYAVAKGLFDTRHHRNQNRRRRCGRRCRR